VAYLENVSRQMTAQADSGIAGRSTSADPAVMCKTAVYGDAWHIDLLEGYGEWWAQFKI
jgi:hypothetical protein